MKFFGMGSFEIKGQSFNDPFVGRFYSQYLIEIDNKIIILDKNCCISTYLILTYYISRASSYVFISKDKLMRSFSVIKKYEFLPT